MRAMTGWIPRPERQPVRIDGSVELSSGNVIPARLDNLSNGGCQLTAATTLPIGASVKLHLAGLGRTLATVQWALLDKAGLRFASELKRAPASVADRTLGLDRPARRITEMRAYIVRPNHEIVDVRVLDLSYDGCGIETSVALRVGEHVKLSVLGRQAADATVRWIAGREAGLQFKFDLAAPEVERRRTQRAPVGAEVFLRLGARQKLRVRLHDLSLRGCSCDFIERPKLHAAVWVSFDGLEPLQATVCWVQEFRIGTSFAKPLHPAIFEMVKERLLGLTKLR